MRKKIYISEKEALIHEWDYSKNKDLKPEEVSIGSHFKVWWKCANGHSWEANIKDRVSGNGCPYCSGKKIKAKENDLNTINPELASEWNYEKNGGLTPDKVAPGSNKKAWLKCYRGHEWEVSLNNRARGRDYPFCYNIYKKSM